jgi:hypothetical protein
MANHLYELVVSGFVTRAAKRNYAVTECAFRSEADVPGVKVWEGSSVGLLPLLASLFESVIVSL